MANSTGNRRLARVSETIRSELARLLLTGVNDPQLYWVTITEVDTSPDLQHARVYFVATGVADQQPVLKRLNKAAPFLQRELGQTLKLRQTPKLKFVHDDSFEKSARIDQLLGEIKDEDIMRKTSESPVAEIGRLVAEAQSILVATHRNPDGDAIGSLLGMSAILSLLGKDHVTFCPDEIPHVLTYLPGLDQLVKTLDPEDRFDMTILLDTADVGLLPAGFPEEAEQRGTFVVIDHHMRHGEMGDVVLRRESSSVGQMLFELSRELVWPIDETVAECLYTSVVADTGSFRYASTTPDTHRVAAELIAAGAQPWKVASALFESYPLARQKIMGEVATTLELSEDGRFACLHSTPQMLEKNNATKADLDGLINLGRSVEGVEIAAMLRLELSGNIKVSFRSRGRIDVSLMASQFGGGGHINAAGCTLKDVDLAEGKQLITEAARQTLVDYDQSKAADGGAA